MAFDQTFWNEKYSGEHYTYGTSPSGFLQEQAHRLKPASDILVPADGEGRNSAFLASQGHRVVATDLSDKGVAKARRLAASAGVSVDHRVLDLFEWDWPEDSYDAVVAIFIQFTGPAGRELLFDKMRRAIRPGGLLFLHGYTPEQLAFGTGGPPIEENLYTRQMLQDAFEGWTIERLETYERVLDEGPGHRGPSALVDLIARRH